MKPIATNQESNLFVQPYSSSFRGWVTKQSLIKNLITDQNNSQSFCYNWRFAYDYNLRGKKYGISLPYKRTKILKHKRFYLSISTKEKKGNMLVGLASTKQTKIGSFYFLSHYCHPEQVNDSLSGAAVFGCVMEKLLKTRNLKYQYIHLLCPETIGSVFYLSKLPKADKDKIIGAIFSDSIGWGKDWCLKRSRTECTLMDKIIDQLKIQNPRFKIKKFGDPYGNDELIFNSVQSDIPAISMYKYPFTEYHTNADRPEKIKHENLQKAEKILLEIVNILEKNKVYIFKHKTPFWMSRLNLFSDDQHEPDLFKLKFKIVYELINGKNSILDISNVLNVPFQKVKGFLDKMNINNLLHEIK